MTDSQGPHPPTHAAHALEELGRLSLRQLSMESLLQAITYTGQLALGLNETQYERDHDPLTARRPQRRPDRDRRRPHRHPGAKVAPCCAA